MINWSFLVIKYSGLLQSEDFRDIMLTENALACAPLTPKHSDFLAVALVDVHDQLVAHWKLVWPIGTKNHAGHVLQVWEVIT